MNDDILEELGTVAREHSLVDSTQAGEHEVRPLDPKRRERMLEAVLGSPPAKQAEQRPVVVRWLALGGLLAAALALIVILPRDEEALGNGEGAARLAGLPTYTIDIEGGIRLQRGDTGPIGFRAGQNIRLVVRPRRAVQQHFDLEVVGVHDGARHRLNWEITKLDETRGIHAIRGAADDLLRLGAGAWSLELMVAGGERLPAEPARVTILGEGE